ncbi:MAG: antibiotic biosynthesis monooxygenase [Thermoproteota archaeon]|nr:antibiotic biosynthesis monooxygenase [Thermoproteota archaeon]
MTRLQEHYMVHHQNNNNNNNNNNDDSKNDAPVTVIVTRKAKKAKVKEFEEWLDGIIHEAMKFNGHMGVDVIRPSDQSNPEYVIIFRFNTVDNLMKWEKSQARKEWLEKSKDVVEGEQKLQKLTGLEFWFTPSSARTTKIDTDIDGDSQPITIPPPPPRLKMAIVTAGIVFVLLSTLIPLIRQITSTLPTLLSTFAAVAVMVFLMTYVIMPLVTRLLRPWLSKKRLF